MSNYLFAIWIILSAALLLLFFYAAYINVRRKKRPQVDLSDVVPFLLPVDIEALSELIDPQNEAASRHTTSKQDFQRLRRKRARQTVEYLRRMSHNAALLQRVGYSRIHSTNTLVAEQGQELIDAGVHVRLYTFVGLTVLFLWRLLGLYAVSFVSLPKVSDIHDLMSSSLIPAYQALRAKAEGLTSLKDSDFREALVHSL
ncbi:MAG TPA: hypothetical protein VG649_11230 [Candidatus Angelobacter sp.]|jgi:hypothetical protein|nr:hypothetical protein [Candidatus Angelobacter sp.]